MSCMRTRRINWPRKEQIHQHRVDSVSHRQHFQSTKDRRLLKRNCRSKPRYWPERNNVNKRRKNVNLRSAKNAAIEVMMISNSLHRVRQLMRQHRSLLHQKYLFSGKNRSGPSRLNVHIFRIARKTLIKRKFATVFLFYDRLRTKYDVNIPMHRFYHVK